ncbi:NAD(P)/FAD-dependent oxidoreductase [Georgenia wutianyii]|uniref:NAD(P)/FAD-dependent oxidoreductase n=1 Tax=Georgenia wutianyii TaxID=2585135 RepID=A0ABX5VPX1_9MICO|nr:NAD(P)/FAD-dependent oxidoreductase [Georgenia wutianyii]QDB80559.1 NAD(P)/FAD-dependent oxidoreductase [Georgenia wutianyii]
MDEQPDTRDVVVIGGGPAGLSAALVLGRARRTVTVVDGGHPRNACSPSLHGFLTRDGATPAEFLAAARRDVAGYGTELVEDEVVAVAGGPDDFRVTLAGGRVLRARRLVAATGVRDELPDVPGLSERWGRDVLHCPYCHGHEVRDRTLAVVADDAEGAVHQALLLGQWSGDVVLLLHGIAEEELDDDGRALLAGAGVSVVAGPVGSLVVADDEVRGVRLEDGRQVACEAVFVAPRFRLNLGPLAALGPRTVAGDMGSRLETDDQGRTSVPGLWAAGNLADLSAQVLGAAELGSRTAIGINGELVLADARERAAARFAPAGGPRRPAME